MAKVVAFADRCEIIPPLVFAQASSPITIAGRSLPSPSLASFGVNVSTASIPQLRGLRRPRLFGSASEPGPSSAVDSSSTSTTAPKENLASFSSGASQAESAAEDEHSRKGLKALFRRSLSGSRVASTQYKPSIQDQPSYLPSALVAESSVGKKQPASACNSNAVASKAAVAELHEPDLATETPASTSYSASRPTNGDGRVPITELGQTASSQGTGGTEAIEEDGPQAEFAALMLQPEHSHPEPVAPSESFASYILDPTLDVPDPVAGPLAHISPSGSLALRPKPVMKPLAFGPGAEDGQGTEASEHVGQSRSTVGEEFLIGKGESLVKTPSLPGSLQAPKRLRCPPMRSAVRGDESVSGACVCADCDVIMLAALQTDYHAPWSRSARRKYLADRAQRKLILKQKLSARQLNFSDTARPPPSGSTSVSPSIYSVRLPSPPPSETSGEPAEVLTENAKGVADVVSTGQIGPALGLKIGLQADEVDQKLGGSAVRPKPDHSNDAHRGLESEAPDLPPVTVLATAEDWKAVLLSGDDEDEAPESTPMDADLKAEIAHEASLKALIDGTTTLARATSLGHSKSASDSAPVISRSKDVRDPVAAREYSATPPPRKPSPMGARAMLRQLELAELQESRAAEERDRRKRLSLDSAAPPPKVPMGAVIDAPIRPWTPPVRIGSPEARRLAEARQIDRAGSPGTSTFSSMARAITPDALRSGTPPVRAPSPGRFPTGPNLMRSPSPLSSGLPGRAPSPGARVAIELTQPTPSATGNASPSWPSSILAHPPPARSPSPRNSALHAMMSANVPPTPTSSSHVLDSITESDADADWVDEISANAPQVSKSVIESQARKAYLCPAVEIQQPSHHARGLSSTASVQQASSAINNHVSPALELSEADLAAADRLPEQMLKSDGLLRRNGAPPAYPRRANSGGIQTSTGSLGRPPSRGNDAADAKRPTSPTSPRSRSAAPSHRRASSFLSVIAGTSNSLGAGGPVPVGLAGSSSVSRQASSSPSRPGMSPSESNGSFNSRASGAPSDASDTYFPVTSSTSASSTRNGRSRPQTADSTRATQQRVGGDLTVETKRNSLSNSPNRAGNAASATDRKRDSLFGGLKAKFRSGD
ncbi:hypothetical protein IE81DRAFT_220669 [Ceraceosorus guamensis]|uniref:Uncharacterized protein n=1 Tax=Ceraceosorus guamensis TaxID=1522189 RepID=A0A316VS56_9BASI|nr:hypothetical protein IE81DRAFT_220669 [Ceraceosorus guamensis]PWN40436.1 hypothetical protein IE81DRAFT_220669 [Ceraceosorus guamensis]